jgi:uncharacterized protein (TIGR00369 family)
VNTPEISERTYQWSDPRQLAATAPTTSGLEFLQRMIKGDLPQSALSSTLDFRLVEADEGRVVVEGRPAAFQGNAIGTVHGGVIASWVDTAMGYAIQTRLAAGISLTTLDIQVRYTRAIRIDAAPVRIVGIAEHVGRRTATARAEVLDEQDRRLATGTTSCLILQA